MSGPASALRSYGGQALGSGNDALLTVLGLEGGHFLKPDVRGIQLLSLQMFHGVE